jgi:Zn-dependent peptidase ImmA (M78 family)/DNA-binding XRE family transcriptional regulator
VIDAEQVANPTRLELARRRRGLSKTRLARLVDVDLRTISAYEKGEFSPSVETLRLMARELKFPVDFFFGPDVEVPNTRIASFRALSRMSASERDAALGAGAIALVLSDWLDRKFELPACDIPDLQGEEPETAAEILRSKWQLGYRPIKNVIHLLEAHGARVFSLAEDTRSVDAFSFWKSDRPLIFLNTAKSAERSRFDGAHELGHIVLHKHGGPHGLSAGQSVEDQANAFASAFLMPASSIWATIRSTPTVSQLITCKKKWVVSVAALLYRLWKLRVVSDWQYRSMCIQIADFRTKEPEPAERESSQVLRKVFDVLRSEGVARSDVARELRIHPSQLEELVFGVIVAEGAKSPPQPSRPARLRPSLRIVK